MRKIVYLLITVVLVMAFQHDSYAQMNRRHIKKNNKRIGSYRGRKSHFDKNKVYNAIGISLNAFNYYGDLSPTDKRISTDLSLTRPAIGISFTHRFGPRYQLVGSFMYGGIRGSDNDSQDPNDTESAVFRYVRNLSFRNRIKELSAVAQIDLFENQSSYISRVPWTPYIYAGLAVFHHNPQAQVPEEDLLGNPFPNAGEWVDLKPLKTEGESYGLFQFAIPFGFGARFKVNEVIDIAGEFGFRYTFTDYLDDVSGNYVDLTTLDSELARSMSYRSNELPKSGPNSRYDEIVNNLYTGYGTFDTVAGYGHINGNGTENPRGGLSGDKDIYTVFTIRATYIIGKTFHRAKFR